MPIRRNYRTLAARTIRFEGNQLEKQLHRCEHVGCSLSSLQWIARTSTQHRCVSNHGPLPIRLLPTPTKCGVRPFPGVKPVKGRRDRPTRDSEQRAECVEGIEASVESKRELVEVGL